MKAVDPFSAGKRGGKEWAVDMGTHQGRSCPIPAGQGAKSSMIDGPFGGKNKA